MQIPLCALADNTVFHLPAPVINGVTYLGYQGIKISGNDGAVCVRVRRDDSLTDQATYWSPGTLVISGPAPNQQPMQSQTAPAEGLVCVCGKKCSSKPGFMLHQKVCPEARQRKATY